MEEIKLIVDSSSNDQTSKENNVTVVPLTLTINGQDFVDDEKLDIQDFIAKMAQNSEAGRTSCPSIDAWLKALEGTKRAIIVTVTSGLSGSFSSAFQAKKIYEKDHPESKVIVVDSRSAGPELSVILSKIKQLIKTKIRFVDLEQKIAEYRMHTHLLAIFQSLHNLSLNGRVSPAVAKVAQMLKIDVVGTASTEGKLEPVAKVRGMKRALKDVINRMKEMKYHGGEVIIDHCNNAKDAQTLKEKICALFPNAQITIRQMRGLCTFYAENGGLMVGFEG
ncbi:DegV family protein [Lactobacillus sp. ESL0791]|uniref:DegV family protein n=1 Tax=Lactobacillus sp. ESL0791 TaxID=2983234 RepID=UPI0023F72E91|nr:DegV family protein [Lactobacillus sp. ESL0791]MDF7639041.1 DegV family protein [Lactobacillus sp. ESL0791]